MNVAIIPAAGQGTRMAGRRPKQFLELAGVPIIFRTLQSFEQCEPIHEIIIVLAAEEIATFQELAVNFKLRKVRAVVPGGATRAASVLLGLQAAAAANPEIVAVHDGVRPFVTKAEIALTVAAAQLAGAAILVSPAVDTIKEVQDGAIVRTLRRADLRHALTPQCFSYTLLRRAYEAVDISDPDLTDESSLVERLGVKVAIVEGSARNIKITRPEDILLGEAILEMDSQPDAVGS
jgi:2-C-methyl-D-erythritol 4-phosphate cytidylyltransferase